MFSQGPSHSSSVPSASRSHSISEASDGWIDAGNESEATSADTRAALSQRAAFLSLEDDHDGANAAPVTSTSDTVPPIKPQHTNNPFLRRKSSAAYEPQKPAMDQDHAAAWAELMPTSRDHAHYSSSQAMAAEPGCSNAYESTLQTTSFGAPPSSVSKDKGPAVDFAANSDSHEPGSVSNTTGGATSARPVRLEEEYPPPPGPPPRKHKNETYQIKHVRWLDYTTGDDTRATPILMQNLNGPCPLLALVNALTMSTPLRRESSLVETLHTREQVSLGLLLDAVVEELITNRMSAHAELPDMVELYNFLLALHTGMNVNPAFISPAEAPNLIDFEPESPALTQTPRVPGGFETTKEMRLYSTFTIPLIHGWLPPRSHPVHAALERSAKTHEDAENLLTREEELEEKLAKEGLSEEEQRLLEDIENIKYFLASSATQLTGYGLDIIAKSMPKGGFAILFRNNHFSTLHKHPVTGNVFSLVTDMGYAKYPEIVWESLVDTNGLGAELFSGDFRTVSHGSIAPVTGTDEFSSDTQGDGRSTVQAAGKGKQAVRTAPNTNGGTSSAQAEAANHEQEDADLALALQLQEEEDNRHRRENPPPRAPSQQTTPQGHRRSSTRGSGVGIPVNSTPSRRGMRSGDPRHHTQSGPLAATRDITRPARGVQQNNSPWSNSPAPQRPAGSSIRESHPDNTPDVPPPSYESALEEQPYNPPANSQHHPTSPVPSPTVPQSNSEGTLVNVNELMARAGADRTAQRSRPRHESAPINFDELLSPQYQARQERRQEEVRHEGPAVVDFNELVARAEAGEGMSSAYGQAARRRRGSTNAGRASAGGMSPRDKEKECRLM